MDKPTVVEEPKRLTEKEIGDLVYTVFYGGEIGGAKERIAAAIWKRVEEHVAIVLVEDQ